MKPLNLYLIFHLNIAYSSIEDEQRPEVIRRCYWPLLHLARKLNLPVGIEASGYTLERIKSIDPTWIKKLKVLVSKGACEFIGSGYAQIIGPLVPAEVNAANLRLGNQVYERLLGVVPETALVNEQAYSASLVNHYLKAGYKAIIMEWDNPAKFHPEWNPEFRYYPQIVRGQRGEEIPVIWNYSIAFQKFQRYAHGEIDIDEYIEYLHKHRFDNQRFFPVYGNDVEIFDFRPNRYETEPEIENQSEWQRIEELIAKLQQQDWVEFVKPSYVLNGINLPDAGKRLSLQSPQQPIPVKKQGKYNITRWAVTGKNDLAINTACWKIYDHFCQREQVSDAEWRQLCYLWSSDFRTHITPKRWQEYYLELQRIDKELTVSIPWTGIEQPGISGTGRGQQKGDVFSVRQKACNEENGVCIETDTLKLKLNALKGLAIEGLWFKEISNLPLLGTIAHGFYDDIALGADFFSGHMILETPGQVKVTDLAKVKAEIEQLSNSIQVRGRIDSRLGFLEKKFTVFADRPQVDLEYEFAWSKLPLGSLRLGMMTLNPEAFESNNLYYSTVNGGYENEIFFLKGTDFDHGEPVSFLVSASHGLALTNGSILLGDRQKAVKIQVDNRLSALIGLMTYRTIADTYFCRVSFSGQEMDETCGNTVEQCESKFQRKFRFSISPEGAKG